MSAIHVVVLIVISALIWAAPLAIILRKAGYSPAWATLGLVPFVGILLLWGVALIPWRGGQASAR
jgi:hypothetical protein